MPGTPEKIFPGAWPDSPVMELPSDSLRELHTSSAAHLAKNHPPLRIIVPPTEYCPFSTDLTLPITPLSLPTPVSSSCFTFSDRQDYQSTSVPPSPTPALLSSPESTAVTDFASPTSSQLLLMPSTPHLEGADSGTAVHLFPPITANELVRSESNARKSGSPRPREAPPSTWLTDLGGYTETDRVFRHNPPEIVSVGTDSSPACTPALSPSAVSPSTQASSPLTPCPYIISPESSPPVRLTLKPTGTDTFPSTLDNLQAWREGITPGFSRSEEPGSHLSEDIHGSQLEELVSETAIYPSTTFHQPHSRRPSRTPRVSRSQTFVKHAKVLGGRVKQLVTGNNANKHRSSMDRGINFSVVTSQDSENGSVILIAAPPPPYDVCPPPHTPHSPTGQQHIRPRTISDYSFAIQASVTEVATTMDESGSRQSGGDRNPLRRLSLAALSTIRRL